MTSQRLLLFGMFALVAYVLISHNKPNVPGSFTKNPSGGNQNTAPADTVKAISGAVSSIFDAIGSVAQSNPDTNG